MQGFGRRVAVAARAVRGASVRHSVTPRSAPNYLLPGFPSLTARKWRRTLVGRVEKETMMRPLRCLARIHRWQSSVVRGEGGEKSVLERCMRCGRERSRSVSLAGRATPNVGDPTTPRPLGVDGAGADG